MNPNKEDITLYGHFVIISSGGILLSYSYSSPLKEGQIVCVPIRQGKAEKKVTAVFLRNCPKPDFECRSILFELPNSVAIKKSQLELIEKVAAYYLTPFEWCVRLLAPGIFWNVEKIQNIGKYFNKVLESKARLEPPAHNIVLTQRQTEVFNSILENINKTILLHGVTGSGKTEIYLTVAKHVAQLGKTCLILVPEISLTPQMAGRFKQVFGEQLSVLHSGISTMEFLKEWISVYLGRTRIVLGVRSAVFCPIENLGLVVVDEEHDQSYKSSERPSYNARDVAVMRAKMEGACCILGSATPSLESYLNSKTEKYKYIHLNEKHAVNTKVRSLIFETQKNKQSFKNPNSYERGKPISNVSNPEHLDCHIEKGILDLITENQANQFQTIVLINRRGFVNYALCQSCKSPLSCPNCSVATTIHNFGKKEICHYCDFNRDIRKKCPDCGSEEFLYKGIGTQNIELFLKSKIENLRVERLDRDTLTSHTKLVKILDRFSSKETDCLVGTQILAKGHDFKNVTLIVILNLEDGLFLPDFRASEKTFHLLTQAMGRVGRGKHAGTIALQSMIKTHPIIDLALNNNVSLFLERELKTRKLAALPPYSRMILLEIKHKEKILAEKYAKEIKAKCLNFWKEKKFIPQEVFLSGPFDAPIEKINQIYRLQICIHMSKNLHPKQCVSEEIIRLFGQKNILKIDVDPQNFM